MKKFFSCALVTVIYWVLMFIGPAIVLLWNNFGYFFTGAGYGPESIMYKILLLLSQPISCFLAASIAGNALNGEHRLCVFANCIVGACYCTVCVFMYTFFVDNVAMLFTMAISEIACIITAYMQSRELQNMGSTDELEKYISENSKLKTLLNDHTEASYVLNLVANKAGVSSVDLARSLFVNFRKASGLSEDAARSEFEEEMKQFKRNLK